MITPRHPWSNTPHPNQKWLPVTGLENNCLFTAVPSSRSPSPGGSLPTFTPSCLWIRLKATRSFSDNWRRTSARWQVMTASPSSRTGEPPEAEVAWNKPSAPYVAAHYCLMQTGWSVSAGFPPKHMNVFPGMSTIVNNFPLSIISLALFMWGLLTARFGKTCVMPHAGGEGTHPPLQPIITYQRVYNYRTVLHWPVGLSCC